MNAFLTIFLTYYLISVIFAIYINYAGAGLIGNTNYNFLSVLKTNYFIVFVIIPLILWAALFIACIFYIGAFFMWLLNKLSLLLEKTLD